MSNYKVKIELLTKSLSTSTHRITLSVWGARNTNWWLLGRHYKHSLALFESLTLAANTGHNEQTHHIRVTGEEQLLLTREFTVSYESLRSLAQAMDATDELGKYFESQKPEEPKLPYTYGQLVTPHGDYLEFKLGLTDLLHAGYTFDIDRFGKALKRLVREHTTKK